MKILVVASLAIRFLLELAALAGLVYWGTSAAEGALGWLLGIGAAALFAVLWGVFVSPRARVELAPTARLGVELALFGAAAIGLAAAGKPVLAVVFAVVAAAGSWVNQRIGPV